MARDHTFKTAILDTLRNGPMTYDAVSRRVNTINITSAHFDFRLDFFALVNAGRVSRVGITPDGGSYLFALSN